MPLRLRGKCRFGCAWTARAASLLTAWFVVAACSAAADDRPNVLLLVMDTTRADHCSFIGYERPTTPHLAEFARDAVTFTDAWSSSGWTGPAHASLFTGLRPDHHGFRDGNRRYLSEGARTLAETFGAAGYATGCFTNNHWIAPETGLARGFETIDAVYARKVVTPGTRAAFTHELAMDWVRGGARAGRPFFLFVNDMEPHMPYSPPADVARAFLRDDPTRDEVVRAELYEFPQPLEFNLGLKPLSPRRLALLADLYDAEIASLDREIGALLASLDAEGLLDETIVVVVSDHGELLGEHGFIEHGYSLHRPALHVPLLIRAKGAFTGGRRVDNAVRIEDVAPTLLELAGLDVPLGLDGVSLTRDLAGRAAVALQAANPGVRELVASALPGVDGTPLASGIQSAYDGEFHYIRWSDGRPHELYDLRRDPGETRNIAPSEPRICDLLARLLPTFD